MAEKKPIYCRACGGNAGHGLAACKNVSGLYVIIQLQDEELDELRDRCKRAEESVKRGERFERDCVWLSRTVMALLDLVELRRAKDGR